MVTCAARNHVALDFKVGGPNAVLIMKAPDTESLQRFIGELPENHEKGGNPRKPYQQEQAERTPHER
jgi:hypothetical protein